MASADSLDRPVVLRDDALLELLLAECKAAGTRAKWASRNGVSAQYVTDVLKGRRAPGDRLLRGLGLQREFIYVSRGRDPEVLP